MSLGFTAWLQEWQTLVAATVAFKVALGRYPQSGKLEQAVPA
jgi:hypothetical protein